MTLMDGVTLLNSYDCGNEGCFIFAIVALIFLGLIILMLFIDGILHGFDSDHGEILVICVALAIIFSVMALTTRENFTYYEVLIDDEVSMTEFTQRYEIVKQEGQIFKIKEREFKNE